MEWRLRAADAVALSSLKKLLDFLRQQILLCICFDLYEQEVGSWSRTDFFTNHSLAKFICNSTFASLEGRHNLSETIVNRHMVYNRGVGTGGGSLRLR
jgi:hypothetical protein